MRSGFSSCNARPAVSTTARKLCRLTGSRARFIRAWAHRPRPAPIRPKPKPLDSRTSERMAASGATLSPERVPAKVGNPPRADIRSGYQATLLRRFPARRVGPGRPRAGGSVPRLLPSGCRARTLLLRSRLRRVDLTLPAAWQPKYGSHFGANSQSDIADLKARTPPPPNPLSSLIRPTAR
jgi:hypothetical protein